MEIQERQILKEKQRIVIKIGSSSLTHPETGEMNLMKIEKLIRVISDLRGEVLRSHCGSSSGPGASQASGYPG